MIGTVARLVLVLSLAACGSGSIGDADGGGGGELDGLMSIRIEPADQTLIIDGDSPAESDYVAIGEFEGGAEQDITEHVAFVLADPNLGSFAGARFTSQTQRGGRTRVRATAGSVSATTPLTLVLRKRWNDPASDALPEDPGGLLDGDEDPERAPQLVYPNDEVLVPPNLRQLELHFYPGEDNTVFEIAFSNAVTDVAVYLQCATPMEGGCIYTPDAQLWSWIAETNRGGEPLAWRVRGTGDGGTAVGTSGERTIAFSFDDIEGGIYYWTTSADTAIMRYDFGATDAEAELFIDTEMTEGRCVGCHSLSRDGTKMVTASDGSTGARVLLLDVGTETPLVPYDSTPRAAFTAWAPDGDRYVGVYAGSTETGDPPLPIDYDLNLFDGSTGDYIESVDVGGTSTAPANHPDWSPMGDRIAYVKVGNRTSSNSLAQAVYRGAIEMVTFSGGQWSAPEVVVPSTEGKNHYYPTFSPDGELILFNESTCPGSETSECDAYEDPSARLQLVAAEPGATAADLARANAPGTADGATTNLTSSFPKWSPFVFQRTDETGSRLMWLTFSSTRQYGLRSPPAGGTLIWMAAVDPDRLDANDPSYPAFVLPFQDIQTSNHTAQWTTEVVTVD